MLFTSSVFLFLFLPIVVAGYYALLRIPVLSNLWLTLASLFFYAWGEPQYYWVMLAVIAVNYVAAICIDRLNSRSVRTLALWATGTVNLLILIAFKYAGFLADNVNPILAGLKMPILDFGFVHLPLGISFFVFHSLSYVVDVYRRTANAQLNPFNMALYISLFPQLVAGPIVRYHDVSDQLTYREHTIEKVATGIRRFVTGLAKKLLIANAVAMPADKIFGLAPDQLSCSAAWLGAICYTIQIYFDFSGYSDMAVGLGLIFGLKLPENFNYPYTARSMREFWQRWHMSLSNWFRDYLYIPLGGNRVGNARICLNLAVVFLLCGIWHGASWQFVAWGLMHGTFLGAERAFLGKLLQRLFVPLQHLYVLLTVICSWVLFRASSFPQALAFYKAMFGLAAPGAIYTANLYLDAELIAIMVVAMLVCTPVLAKVASIRETLTPSRPLVIARTAFAAGAFAICIFEVSAGTYNPFIYFRF